MRHFMVYSLIAITVIVGCFILLTDVTRSNETATQRGNFWNSPSMASSNFILHKEEFLHQSADYRDCGCPHIRHSAKGKLLVTNTTWHNEAGDVVKPLDIAVVSFSYGERYAVVANLSSSTKFVYTRKHGYKFYDINGQLSLNISDPKNVHKVVWNKIVLLQEVLANHEWIIWMDADAFFLNLQKSLETITEACTDPSKICDMIIAEDNNGINAGIVLFRRSRWTFNLFKEIMQMQESINHPHQEQYAMKLIVNREANKKFWTTVPQRNINSNEAQYQAGDLILHVAGNYMWRGEHPSMKSLERRIENHMKNAWKRDGITYRNILANGETDIINFLKSRNCPLWLDSKFETWAQIPVLETIPLDAS